jgi:hypothetical protein
MATGYIPRTKHQGGSVPTFTTVRPINHLACGACQYESVRLSFPPSLDGARPSVVRPRWATTTHRTARHGEARSTTLPTLPVHTYKLLDLGPRIKHRQRDWRDERRHC